MSKALKAGKKPFYEHPWIQDTPDSSDNDDNVIVEEEEDIGPLEDDDIEDDPQQA